MVFVSAFTLKSKIKQFGETFKKMKHLPNTYKRLYYQIQILKGCTFIGVLKKEIFKFVGNCR